MESKTKFGGAWVQAWVFINAEEFEGTPTDAEVVERARELYEAGSNDDLEIDDSPKISWLEEIEAE